VLLVGLGALASMRATGHLMDRHGGRVTAWAVGALGVCGVLPGLASSFWELSLSLLVVGAASGATDVAINAEGVWAEDASGRPLLNLAHASFSGSVVVASLSVGGLRALGGSSALALGAAGAVVASIAVALGVTAPTGRRLGTGSARSECSSSSQEGWGVRPPGWLVLLGAMTALAYWQRRGAAVSIVTSIAYLGFLVGPAGVGALAALTSLRSSLTAVSALAVGLAALAALAPLPARRRSSAAIRG
jgi:hypothetical protein